MPRRCAVVACGWTAVEHRGKKVNWRQVTRDRGYGNGHTTRTTNLPLSRCGMIANTKYAREVLAREKESKNKRPRAEIPHLTTDAAASAGTGRRTYGNAHKNITRCRRRRPATDVNPQLDRQAASVVSCWSIFEYHQTVDPPIGRRRE